MMARRLFVNFAPGLAALLRYDRQWLRADVLAGLSVAALALPAGIAYADLAGVPAIIGIYSAIFPLLAYALFGSSRQLIIRPDAATCLLLDRKRLFQFYRFAVREAVSSANCDERYLS
jgi:MFS superfamily sulfate permease-like transporter